MKYLSVLAGLLCLQIHLAANAGCDSGFQAFKTTVYAKIQRDCVGCHGGINPSAHPAPLFGVQNPAASYAQLGNYVDFSDVNNSLLAVRAGNNHCGISLCQTASGQEMITLIGSWWQGGENQCHNSGNFITPAQNIPANLPGQKDGFTTMTFDLSGLKPELKGVAMQVEVQEYLPASQQTLGALRFRSPRFVGGSDSIYLKGLRILLNGGYAPTANIYSGIDRQFSFVKVSDPVHTATAIVSGDSMIILKDGASTSQISVGFDDIQIRSGSNVCPNAQAYTNGVKPVIGALNCVSCHGSKPTDIGTMTLNFSTSDSQQCQTVSDLMDNKFFMLSAFLKVPSEGLSQHPQLSDDQRTQLVSALRAWINQ